ncbi:ferredoxin [Streptococcus saliviloxodontae]|uniref:Ferredoxin n=1 Tax=Streptococcus saliviloxodontae TaxID=1349416 RepID=A0ABS2PMF9_9STRE|nr:ferredoxin [Streptococcus saliviloxodontae]MBM7636619.1 ferredoxin [Streptococcus saliviloxodontae]
MKVSIVSDKCIACGLCQTYSPFFDYDDNGIVTFSQTDQSVCETSDDDLDTLTAVKACPTKALTIL